MRMIVAAVLGLTLASPVQAQTQAQGGARPQEQVSPLDRLVHEQLLVLDTHLDTPMLLQRPGWDIGDYHHYAWDGSQVDIPRMAQGGLDGGFFVIYTRQGPLTPEGFAAARNGALVRAAEIQRMVAGHADVFAFASAPEDAARIAAQGKRIVLPWKKVAGSIPIRLYTR